LDEYVDPTGGLFICAYIQGDSCTSMTVINNVVAGVYFTGYIAVGHNCGVYDNSFKNNIAHSILGTGAIIYPNPSQASQFNCYEGSYFAAYKCTLDGVVSIFKTKEVIFSNLVLIDNGWGISANVGYEADLLWSIFKDSFVYGESEARDCLTQNACTSYDDPLTCIDKHGVYLPYF
jgi:hypothetical protein